MTYPQIIPAAFNEYNEPTLFVRTSDATGAQLALAIFHDNQLGHYELNELWRSFRNAGGSAKDCVGTVLKWGRSSGRW
jgi:hypothetical protein